KEDKDDFQPDCGVDTGDKRRLVLSEKSHKKARQQSASTSPNSESGSSTPLHARSAPAPKKRVARNPLFPPRSRTPPKPSSVPLSATEDAEAASGASSEATLSSTVHAGNAVLNPNGHVANSGMPNRPTAVIGNQSGALTAIITPVSALGTFGTDRTDGAAGGAALEAAPPSVPVVTGTKSAPVATSGGKAPSGSSRAKPDKKSITPRNFYKEYWCEAVGGTEVEFKAHWETVKKDRALLQPYVDRAKAAADARKQANAPSS
ncbi:hypothetical protein HDZ31DRAFT_77158, partial [Schizophyllum fasciatum]